MIVNRKHMVESDINANFNQTRFCTGKKKHQMSKKNLQGQKCFMFPENPMWRKITFH